MEVTDRDFRNSITHMTAVTTSFEGFVFKHDLFLNIYPRIYISGRITGD